MLKPKQTKTCRSCEEQFSPFNTMEKMCIPCALKKGRENRAKDADKNQKAKHKSIKKDLRDFNRKDISWQHKLTQKAFNKMRVLEELQWFTSRGLEPECISCGKKNMDWCCGHLKTVGSAGRLRYDRKNTFLQCNRYCNMALSGNINGNKTTRGYIRGLEDRFMIKGRIVIEDHCRHNSHAKKWEWQELEEMRVEFNSEIKELKGLT